MVTIAYLASTVLMALFMVGVVVALLRFGEQRGYSVDTEGGSGDTWDTTSRRLSAVAGNQTAWIVGFVVLVLVFGGGVYALLSGTVSVGAGATAMVGGALAAVIGLYVLVGAFRMVRDRGRSTAEAVGVSAWMLGVLFVLAIAAKLLA